MHDCGCLTSFLLPPSYPPPPLSLSLSLSLSQLLNDVLAEISPEHRIDLRQEPPEQTAVRIFSLLRVLKYMPRTDEGGGLNAFRQGLLQGALSLSVRTFPCLVTRPPLGKYYEQQNKWILFGRGVWSRDDCKPIRIIYFVEQTTLDFDYTSHCIHSHANPSPFLSSSSGDRATVYPLLHWLLERTADLKKRAYLARYLVRVEVPPEFLQVRRPLAS